MNRIIMLCHFFALNELQNTKYGVQIDNGKIVWNTTDAKENSNKWSLQVLGNRSIGTSKLLGKHVLKIICDDLGVIIQKIIIDLGGKKSAYTGPDITYLN